MRTIIDGRIEAIEKICLLNKTPQAVGKEMSKSGLHIGYTQIWNDQTKLYLYRTKIAIGVLKAIIDEQIDIQISSNRIRKWSVFFDIVHPKTSK